MTANTAEHAMVHVANSFAVGGTERQLRTLAAGLALHLPDLVQHFALSKYDASDTMDADFREIQHRFRYLSVGNLDESSGQENNAFGLTSHGTRAIRMNRINAYRRIFSDIKPRAVMVWKPDTAALLAAVMEGVGTVLFRAGSIAPVLRPYATEMERAEYAFMSECFLWLRGRPGVVLVANSAVARQQFIAHMHWTEKASSVLYNAFDTSQFSSSAPATASRKILGLPIDGTIVGGSFRLSPEKQPFLWLATAEMHLRRPGAERDYFAIAGGGEMFEAMNAWIKHRRLSDRIFLLGQLDGTIPDFYNAIDVLLHTSAFEGLPNAVIEAQSMGVPVVATRAGGTEEAFVPGRTGTRGNDRPAGQLSGAAVRVQAIRRPEVFC
jgi:glycosyltransferase involved in cell wall biosynthesis